VTEAATAVGGGVTKCTLQMSAVASDITKIMSDFGKERAEQIFDVVVDGVEYAEGIVTAALDLQDAVRAEPPARMAVYTQKEVLTQALQNLNNVKVQGEKLLSEQNYMRLLAASNTQQYRYQDMSFRIFRNEALQKYRAQFDLAARYAYLAAKAYDYETNLLSSNSGSGQRFLTDIVKQRSLGAVINDKPVAGSPGLSDPLARLSQNFSVLRGQLGFNNPIMETNGFSLRNELFRAADTATWINWLRSYKVDNLWTDEPDFKRYCRPFSSETEDGPQPGLVIPFESMIKYSKNFFGKDLQAGDNYYDPTVFTTKINALGIAFNDYDITQLSNTPKVYLIPTGLDVMTSPSSDTLKPRQWRVVDQKLPAPFPIGASSLTNPDWIPVIDSLSDELGGIRKFSSMRAYHDKDDLNPAETITNSRLVGRSVWNTQWKLIIPSASFLYNPAQPDDGIEKFINSVSDIKLFFLTYGYSGN